MKSPVGFSPRITLAKASFEWACGQPAYANLLEFVRKAVTDKYCNRLMNVDLKQNFFGLDQSTLGQLTLFGLRDVCLCVWGRDRERLLLLPP